MSSSNLPTVSLHNTLTRRVEPLVPQVTNAVGVYCCGPTVYNFQHIGNLRTYIFEDVLVRTLRHAGYAVKHVMNITDVGHLVSDADDGEDKMLVAMQREGKRSHEIAEYYTNIFFEHCAWLNITKPDIVCKATEHIQEMIEIIRRLEEKGAAYQAGGNVYFDVSADADYGKLAGLDLETLKAGARIEVDTQKRNPADFALWFTKSKFENQELQWDSPWGRGYPGWHIECSAMAMKYLGESFDIHCGGIDHIPVHHTNEIAQSETASGKPFASIWLHGGFLVVGADKMSKSTGGFLTLNVIKDRGIDPLSYRLLCYSGIYRNELSWSFQSLEAAETTLKRLQSSVASWRQEASAPSTTISDAGMSDAGQNYRQTFCRELYNDLNMPKVMAVVHQMSKDNGLSAAEKLGLLLEFDEVLGLGVANWQVESQEFPEEALRLLAERDEARARRDWKTSDAIRERIADLGFLVEDTKVGGRLTRK